MLKRGKFITLEGGEGSGKSTLSKSLHSSLDCHLKKRGLNCHLTREPGGIHSSNRDICNQLRSLICHPPHSTLLANETELYLFLASQFQNLSEFIEPALSKGDWVICDRYCDSTLCYQGYGRCKSAKELNFVKSLCKRVLNRQTPNLTIYLDVDPEIGLKRTEQVNRQADRIQAEALTFHKKVRRGYLTLQKSTDRIELIDATLCLPKIHQRALYLIQKRIGEQVAI